MSKFFYRGRPDVMGKYGQTGFSPKRSEKRGSEAHPLSLVVNSAERQTAVEAILSSHNLFASIELDMERDEDISELDFVLNIPKPQRFDKVPERNEPCLCGSGKKYKKCCG